VAAEDVAELEVDELEVDELVLAALGGLMLPP
jgi:hypothetical protein